MGGDALDQFSLLRRLTSTQRAAVASAAHEVVFPARQRIFEEGQEADGCWLIRHGRVALETVAPGRGAIVVQTLGPGDVLGWSWLFPPYYWHFDARAVEATEAVFFYGTRLREECEDDHDLGYELMKRMASVIIHRLQATRRHLLEARVGR